MKVIGCLGRKGGSGKTMTAHLLAHGLAKAYGVYTNLVMTDVREDMPLNISPYRDYYISAISNKDAQTDSAELDRIFTQTARNPDSILIIDGGANRANVDRAFARFCDMVMIPVGYGKEDIQVAQSDFWNIVRAMKDANTRADVCIIRNRWPGAGRERDRVMAKPWVRDFLEKSEMVPMLFPDFIPDMPSLLDMANSDNPKTTPLIDAVSARFAEVVAKKTGFELPPRRKLVPYPHLSRLHGEEAAA